MFRETILEIFNAVWPMIIICSVIIVSMRLTYIFKNKVKIVLYEELLGLLFIIYVMCLFYVVSFQDVSWSTSNFILFTEMFRYEFGTNLFFKNVVGNMIMFVPYGFFVSYILKLKNPFSILILSFLASITIEITQLLIGRVFDVDDIILNIIGSVFGFYLYKFLNAIKKHLPNVLKNQYIYIILMISGIIFIVLYLFNIIKLGVWKWIDLKFLIKLKRK